MSTSFSDFSAGFLNTVGVVETVLLEVEFVDGVAGVVVVLVVLALDDATDEFVRAAEVVVLFVTGALLDAVVVLDGVLVLVLLLLLLFEVSFPFIKGREKEVCIVRLDFVRSCLVFLNSARERVVVDCC